MTTLSPFADAVDDAVQEVPDPPAVPTRPSRTGGLTLPVLAFAALVASPAIWQCLVAHTVPMHVMLERYVVIALGCLAVSEAARRMLRSAAPATPTAPAGESGEPVDPPHDAGL